MAYRFKVSVSTAVINRLQEDREGLVNFVGPVVEDALNITQQWAVRNLSGVSFSSKTGNWAIQKRSGMSSASVQVQYPFGKPYAGRVYAYRGTRYDGNPEEYNVLKILEEGRGEVLPKYTPSARGGFVSRASLVIPVENGGRYLVSGQNGFRGVTGNYRFVKRLPPMQGRYWMQAAATSAEPEIQEMVRDKVVGYLSRSL